jgi:hypothetical protein
MDDEIQQEDGIKYGRRLLRLMFWLEQTGRRMHLVFQPCSVY